MFTSTFRKPIATARARFAWGSAFALGILVSGLMASTTMVGLAVATEKDPDETIQTPDAETSAQPLEIRRSATQDELRDIAKTLAASTDKAKALEASIAAIEKTKASLRLAIVQSASRRKDLERRIIDQQDKISVLATNLTRIKASLHERRGVLAEVLAALQRMGRNPPPALLVSPDDALSSVRSAILLGAVVPEIRGQAEKLASDLSTLAKVNTDLTAEKENFVLSLSDQIEEGRRMDRLIFENDIVAGQNARDLESERKKAADLASKATSLEGLIVSLERDIASAREAADQARREELKRRGLSPEEKERAKALAESAVPDKNRIAPAFVFSDLEGKLDLPVAGVKLRAFGEDDGTGHTTSGLIVGTEPGSVVTAPADAWIVFAGPFRSYGQTVILNLGDGFHMVMTGMGQTIAHQGQFVVAGEPLGQMGEKRVASAAALALETDRPTLYIELRKDGKPVDSKPWWAVRDLGKARNDT